MLVAFQGQDVAVVVRVIALLVRLVAVAVREVAAVVVAAVAAGEIGTLVAAEYGQYSNGSMGRIAVPKNGF